MAEINARTLMFNLGPEDAIDSTPSAKIARYAERKQLAYKITKKGTLLLDGRGKKIHLRKGVVTLRNALDLHALPERVVSRYRIDDFRNDNIVLTTDPNLTKQANMLHVGETGASCYNFHSNSIFHKNMQARDYFLT